MKIFYDENLNNKKIDKLASYMDRLFVNKECSLSRVQELLTSIYKRIAAEKNTTEKNDVVDKYIEIYRNTLQENLAKIQKICQCMLDHHPVLRRLHHQKAENQKKKTVKN